MSFNSQFEDGEEALMNDINMTPFIDVMLVLLIVFMITLPVINHAVKVNLPKAQTQPLEKEPQAIDIAITADGALSWNKIPVSDDELQTRLAELVKLDNKPPAIRIFADTRAEYGRVSLVMTSAQHLGLNKLDFVIDRKI